MSKEEHRIYFCKDGAILDTQFKDGEDVKDTLNRCFKKISDLEAKLAESEKEIKEWIAVRDDKNNVINKQTEKINQLKQQLAEKDKLLREKIGSLKTTDFIRLCLDCGFMVDAKDKDNQDKISFAVEQLECLKNKIPLMSVQEIIDAKIWELTHQHEGKGE